MFRNFSPGLPDTRIASFVFAGLLLVAVTAPLEASGVTNLSDESRRSTELQLSTEGAPESPSDETIRVHIWIPGFDDDEPVWTCSPIPTRNLSTKKPSNPAPLIVSSTGKSHFSKLADSDACSGLFRMLPWFSRSVPGRVEFLLPII